MQVINEVSDLLSTTDLFDISCSAGVGRTGCFIAASVGIEEIKVCIYLQQVDNGHLPYHQKKICS